MKKNLLPKTASQRAIAGLTSLALVAGGLTVMPYAGAQDETAEPVAATAEFTLGDSNVFLGADLGYAFFTKKDLKNENGSFYYQPKLGYSFDKRHDLYFSCKGFTRNNANAGSINLGYAYNF